MIDTIDSPPNIMTPKTEKSDARRAPSRLRFGWIALAVLPLVGWAIIEWRAHQRAHAGPTPATTALAITAPVGADHTTSPAVPVANAPSTTSPATAPVFTQSADVTEGAVGPWGQMQYVPIVLEIPEDYITVEQATAHRDKWTFAYRSRATATELMRSCGVTDTQLALIPATAWQESDSGSVLEPSDAFLLDLSPDARAALYAQLARDPANELAIDPMWFREGRVDFRLRASNLSDASIALLKRLLYPGPSNLLLFNDESAALRAINDPAEQARFFAAIERKRSLMARVIITPESDTNALAAFWGKGGRESNLLPLLDSIKFNAEAGVENPGRINILSLLPPFVQERLYRHALMNVPVGKHPEDCFWTSFNFFSDVPDDRINEPDYLNALIERSYFRIDQPGELGDVVLIADENGTALHAANYIADNVLFTKNGLSATSPWMLAPMRDVIDMYQIRHDKLKVYYYRKVRAAVP